MAALSVPTLTVRWKLGHIDWAVAGLFAAGALPASDRQRPGPTGEGQTLQRAFGWFLVGFGLLFTSSRLLSGHRSVWGRRIGW